MTGLSKVGSLFALNNNAKFSLRTAVGVTLAAFLAFLFHYKMPYWSVITVIIVMNPYVSAAFQKSIYRLVATLVGAMLGLVIASLVVNHFSLYLLVCFLLGAIPQYFVLTSRYPYIFLLGSLTALIVFTTLIFSPEQPFLFAYWRVTEVGTGIISAWVSLALIFPNAAKQTIYDRLDDVMKQAGDYFESFQSSSSSSLVQRGNYLLALDKAFAQSKAELELYKNEQSVPAFEIERLKDLLLQIHMLSNELYVELYRKVKWLVAYWQGKYQFDIDIILSSFVELLQECRVGLKREPISFKVQEQLKSQLEQLSAAYEKFRLSDDRLDHEIEYTSGLNVLIADLFRYEKIISQLLEKIARLHKKPTQAIHQKKEKFANWTLDTLTIQHSVKSGLSIVIAVLAWIVSDWFAGIQGIISSIVVSQQPYTYDARLVAWRRVLGCFIGGGIGLLALRFFMLNIFDLLIILFFVSWLFGYYTFASVKYSYPALQANIALGMCLVQSGRIVDIALPLQRLSGIFFGIIAVLLVSYLVWPRHPKEIIKKVTKALQHQLLDFSHDLLLVGESVDQAAIAAKFVQAEKLLASIKLNRGADSPIFITHDDAIRQLKQQWFILLAIQKNGHFSELVKMAEQLSINWQEINRQLVGAMFKAFDPSTPQSVRAHDQTYCFNLIHQALLKSRLYDDRVHLDREALTSLLYYLKMLTILLVGLSRNESRSIIGNERLKVAQ